MNSYSSVDRILPFPLLEQKGHDLDEHAVANLAAEATAITTTTMTQFKTPPTVSSSIFFASLPYYTTTITTTATAATAATAAATTTFTTHPSPHAAPLEHFSFDNTSPWHHLFPALVVFAILGVLSTVLLLLLVLFCFYRRQRRRRRLHSLEEESSTMNASRRPALFGHSEKVQTPASTTTTLHHLGIPETSNNNSNNNQSTPYDHHQHLHQQQQQQQQQGYHVYPVSESAPTTPHRYHYYSTATPHTMASSSPVSSTFIPIETSPLTLVPRAAIWKDPQRRRGVNELDLWEQKQQQQQQRRTTTITPSHQRVALAPASSTSATHNKIQPLFTAFPFLQSDKDDDDDDDDDGDVDGDDTTTDASLDNGRDRPWQRYVQSSSRPVDLFTLNDDDGEDQHSLHSSSTILHTNPIYDLNQEIDGPSSTETSKTKDIASHLPLGELESSGSSQWLCAPSTFKS